MTRRFKVFVALNLAGVIGIAAWYRRDIPPPDPGDLVLVGKPVPEEDNALPYYTWLVEHLATKAWTLDADSWELLRLALSKPYCQRGGDDILGGANSSAYLLHLAVLKEFQLIHDREVLTQNWSGALSNLHYLARFNRHMEEFSLRNGTTSPRLGSRNYLVPYVQQLALMAWADPDELAAILERIPPISEIFPAFARNYFTDCEIMLTDMSEFESLLQLNRTRASLIHFLEMQKMASITPLNSDVHADINREIHALQDLLANHGKLRALWSPNYNGERTLNYVQQDWVDWPRQRCLMDTSTNLARALVASLRYQRNHGKMPPRLEDLVPTYLPTVPLDAYDGLPLGYDPANGFLFSRWPLKQNRQPEMGEDILTKAPTTRPTEVNGMTVWQIPPAQP